MNTVCSRTYVLFRPIPVAGRPKAKICGRSLAGIAGSNPAGAVCCQVEVFATGRSLVHRSDTDCGVSLCVI